MMCQQINVHVSHCHTQLCLLKVIFMFQHYCSFLFRTTLGARDFSSAVSGSVMALAYGRRCVGLRPTPKIPAAHVKTSGTQGSLEQE